MAKYSAPVSPYRLAKDSGKIPQMVYNYIRMGLIKASRGPTGKWTISPDEANRVFDRWTAK